MGKHLKNLLKEKMRGHQRILKDIALKELRKGHTQVASFEIASKKIVSDVLFYHLCVCSGKNIGISQSHSMLTFSYQTNWLYAQMVISISTPRKMFIHPTTCPKRFSLLILLFPYFRTSIIKSHKPHTKKSRTL